MSTGRHNNLLLGYQLLAGTCDTVTGLLLIVSPGWTLSLMGVIQNYSSALISFVGTFVLAVGLFYFYPLRFPTIARNAQRWQTVWVLTALIRSLVAAFLLLEISAQRMELAWITVAISDGALGAIQWTGLAKGWLRFDRTK